MDVQRLWGGTGLPERLLRALLVPISFAYALGWQCYAAIYKVGLKKAKHPHSPIICVGNLTVGGLGKTPLTTLVAQHLKEAGYKVVVGCSGYGSPHEEAAAWAPDGALDPAEWGDEPTLIRELLPNVPIVVGRRRVLAAELCHQKYPDAILVMDDGMQHLPLVKDITIALAPLPGGNRWCLPAGPYREPARNIARVDLQIRVSESKVAGKSNPPSPSSLPSTVLPPGSSGGREIAARLERKLVLQQKPKTAYILCAIGRPDVFFEAVKSVGVEVKDALLLSDHDPLTEGNLIPSDWSKDVPIVVTLKDWVKLKARTDLAEHQFIVAREEVSVEGIELGAWLISKLNGIKK